MFIVDELQNPAKYGLASMLRAGATIRFARGGDLNTTVVPEELAVAAVERTEAENTTPEKQTTLSVDLIPGSNRIVTTITNTDTNAVMFHIPAWWSDNEFDKAYDRQATYL